MTSSIVGAARRLELTALKWVTRKSPRKACTIAYPSDIPSNHSPSSRREESVSDT